MRPVSAAFIEIWNRQIGDSRFSKGELKVKSVMLYFSAASQSVRVWL